MKFALEIDATESGEVRLAAVIDDEVIWPHPGEEDGSSDFDPEDLLSYLADSWLSLLLAQSWPIRFEADQEPRSITGLLRAAEDRWQQFSAAEISEVEVEGGLLDEFLYHHDLSEMRHGAGLNSCFVLRQQNRVRIETNREVYDEVRFGDFADELTRLGTFAANLLQPRRDVGSVQRVIERWQSRDRVDAIAAAALISGLPRAEIEASNDLQVLLVRGMARRPLSAIANDNSNPEYAAARISGALGPGSVADVLRRLRALPDGKTGELAALRRLVRRDLRGIERPLDQGIRAANIVRDWLGQADDSRVDLENLSRRLGIHVEPQSIPDKRLDGIATVGPRHGPAILLNRDTRRQGSGPADLERSLRFTWSHEIGHLVLDQNEWPALIDAARQRVPREVEVRANAFAAYLLLRPDVAHRWWERYGSPLTWAQLEPVLNQITDNFGLPRIAASRQLARGAPTERRKHLEAVFRAHIANFDGPAE
jgi:Zn-dependent peptidase ImmA (M78 family)